MADESETLNNSEEYWVPVYLIHSNVPVLNKPLSLLLLPLQK